MSVFKDGASIDRLNVTVFGSCRVHTPFSRMEKDNKLKLNQKNIYGYTHYTSEILQQFEIIAGTKIAKSRLRPYMNIPKDWRNPEKLMADFSKGNEYFEELSNRIGALFCDTDVFIVEVSSIRKVQFKAVYLQINRVRDLLVDDAPILERWWNPMMRNGSNCADELKMDWNDSTKNEVGYGIRLEEQTLNEIANDLNLIIKILKKPVIFVSHFDTDYKGNSIPQRKKIIDSIKILHEKDLCRFVDPTYEVKKFGIDNSISDLGHYREVFIPHISEILYREVAAISRIICGSSPL